MPGPKPKGERALTPAERAARYRAARAVDAAPVVKVRYRKPADRRSRPQQWHDAVVKLLELQADYQVSLDGLPESLVDTPTADALRTVCELDVVGLGVGLGGIRPALRTLGGHVLWVICNACQHAVEADQPALIAAGRGDVPLVDLRFRCSVCGL